MGVRPQTMATLLKPSCGSGSLREQVKPPTVAASGYMTPPPLTSVRGDTQTKSFPAMEWLSDRRGLAGQV